MADIQRLIVAAVIALVSWGALADYQTVGPVTAEGSYAFTECNAEALVWGQQFIGYRAASAPALADKIAPQAANFVCSRGLTFPVAAVANTTLDRIRISFNRGGSWAYVYIKYAVAPECETGNYDPITGSCLECPDGEVWNGMACENACPSPKFVNWLGVCVDPCPAAGTDPVRLNVNGGNPVCSGGCEKRATRCALRIDVGGTQTGSLRVCDYVSTGNQCEWSGERAGENDGSDPPDPEPDPQPDPCPSGQQRGQYNGQDICVKTGDTTDVNTEQTDTTETTNPDGSKTTTETRTETRIEYNSTTNTTTTTTTTTTTNTVRDSSGNVTDTNTTITVGQKQTNGNNVDAEDSAGGGGDGGGEEGGGVFAGTCGLEPVCEGDAIQCAIAAATFKSQCALVVAPDVISEWQQIVEFDGTAEGAGLDRKTIEVPETLNVTMTGGGVGLVDQSFVVLGKTIVLPFSAINPYLDIFGAAMLAIAWIMAFGIIRSAI